MVQLLLVIIYLSFISLGLPDALLGAAWPVMCQELSVPVSYAGVISMVIAAGTIISSLQSDRLTKALGTGKVTAISVGITAAALFGFAGSRQYWMLLLWAIPYGLGAGSVDAALNNYVALHYASRHMSWLHGMWGLGASVGPYIMGRALTGGMGWNSGYRYIGIMQIVLVAIIFFSLPLWKGRKNAQDKGKQEKPLTLKQVFSISGAKEVMLAFFCYCGLEQTCMLWGSSYLVLHMGIAEDRAAGMAALFMLGITAGRFASGFLSYKLNDANLTRLGQGILALGVVLLLLPLGVLGAEAGLLLMGLGCAPIYPCVIHSTPAHFGEKNSQAIIGVQMASAYIGILVIPPLFGTVAEHIGAGWFPVYVGVILVLMTVMSEKLNRVHGN